LSYVSNHPASAAIHSVDRLYDFKAFVATSHIPGSGNGAFLKLVRVRVRKEAVSLDSDSASKDKTDDERNTLGRPLTRCPLIMKDQNGKETKVFIGPDRIHDDDGPDDSDGNYFEDNTVEFSSWDRGCGSINIGCYGPFYATGTLMIVVSVTSCWIA